MCSNPECTTTPAVYTVSSTVTNSNIKITVCSVCDVRVCNHEGKTNGGKRCTERVPVGTAKKCPAGHQL